MGLEANIRHVTPYVPGSRVRKSLNLIQMKIHTHRLLEQWRCCIRWTRRSFGYPDPEIKMLTECLASRYQVRPEQVFVGVGSDDVLAMSFFNIFNSGKPVLFPDITYSFTRYGPSFLGSVYMPVSGWNHAHQSRRLLRRKRRHYPCESQRTYRTV